MLSSLEILSYSHFFLSARLLFGLLLTPHCILVINSGFKISDPCTFLAPAISTHYEKQFTSPSLLPTTTRQEAPSAPNFLVLMPLCDLLFFGKSYRMSVPRLIYRNSGFHLWGRPTTRPPTRKERTLLSSTLHKQLNPTTNSVNEPRGRSSQGRGGSGPQPWLAS